VFWCEQRAASDGRRRARSWATMFSGSGRPREGSGALSSRAAHAVFSRRQSGKRGRLCFSPAPPTVHEFDGQSPTIRRLGLRRSVSDVSNTRSVDPELLRVEMEARGLNPKLDKERAELVKRWNAELQEELEHWGLPDLDGSNQDLSAMLDLVGALRRRANLSLAFPDTKLPIDMPCEVLEKELEDRKIDVSCIKSRLAKVVALEEAMLKEGDVIVGDGYDFGRRFISVEDLVIAEDLNNEALRSALRARGVKPPKQKIEKIIKLEEVLESELEDKVQQSFREELIKEIRRRRVTPKLAEMRAKASLAHQGIAKGKRRLSRSVSPTPRKKERPLRDSDVVSTQKSTSKLDNGEENNDGPIVRLEFDSLSTSQEDDTDKAANEGPFVAAKKVGQSAAFSQPSNPPAAPTPPGSPREIVIHAAHKTQDLFLDLFHSGTWRADYESLPRSQSNGKPCVIS